MMAAISGDKIVPYHTNRRIHTWLTENLCDAITPNIRSPNSQELYALNYYARGAVERKTNKTPCCSKDELKAEVTADLSNLKKETVGKVCRRFRSRLKAVVEANGDFFE